MWIQICMSPRINQEIQCSETPSIIPSNAYFTRIDSNEQIVGHVQFAWQYKSLQVLNFKRK